MHSLTRYVSLCQRDPPLDTAVSLFAWASFANEFIGPPVHASWACAFVFKDVLRSARLRVAFLCIGV